jgi:DNA invertase Pin-like site-specific DNA recombinase
MTENRLIPAAQYLRMSTEHQQYSLENQSAKIGQYAVKHGFEIVCTYSDEAKSGLTLRNRSALFNLLRDAGRQDAGFNAILVYDISRWGRFQDVDEAAYYEFRCKAAGIPVHYCAEEFANDGSIPSAIMKTLKRTMAGEYSRELGVKVLAGQKYLAGLGFKQGGIASYGFCRMQVSREGTYRHQLAPGERKNILTDHVVLAPGSPQEIDTVREIYRLLTVEKRMPYWIARELNRRGIPYLGGRQWGQQCVTRVLTHPKYAGCCVFNRSTQRIGVAKRSHTNESEWVLVPGAYKPIISPETFKQAQQILKSRSCARSNEEILDGLRRLLADKGKLTTAIIDECPYLPGAHVYDHRFGGMLKAYAIVGYKPSQNNEIMLWTRAHTLMYRDDLTIQLLKLFPDDLAMSRRTKRWRPLFQIRGGPVLSLQIANVAETLSYTKGWRVNPNKREKKNITLLVRLNRTNDAVFDFHVLPDLDCTGGSLLMRENDPRLLCGEPLANLPQLLEVVRRVVEKNARRCKANPKVFVTRVGLRGSCLV